MSSAQIALAAIHAAMESQGLTPTALTKKTNGGSAMHRLLTGLDAPQASAFFPAVFDILRLDRLAIVPDKKWWSACGRLAKSRGLATKRGRIVRDVMRHNAETEAMRPKTRADCAGGHRPCPWVSCRYHLQVEVSAHSGQLIERIPVERWTHETPTCALDIAEAGALTSTEVAAIGGTSRQAVEQTELRALIRLNAAAEAQALAQECDIHQGHPSIKAERQTPEPTEGRYAYIIASEMGRAFLRSVIRVEPVRDVPLDSVDLGALQAEIRQRNGAARLRHFEARRRMVESRPQTLPKEPTPNPQPQDIQWI